MVLTDNVCGPFPTLRLDSGREFKGDCEDEVQALLVSIMDGEYILFRGICSIWSWRTYCSENLLTEG